MRHPMRLTVFVLGSAAMIALYVLAFARLPGQEAVRGQYLKLVNLTCVGLRHTTDAVTAVNFDYRGFDTLGEEFILFVSVMGTLVLLRQHEEKGGEKRPDAAEPQRSVEPSDTLRVCTL